MRLERTGEPVRSPKITSGKQSTKGWKSKTGSCTKSIRDDLPNGKPTFIEESSRDIYEMGNMELVELRQNLGDHSMSFLPEARTRGSKILWMWRLASTQSKYDGANQKSICNV